MQQMPSKKTLPRIRNPIPTSRHARSMGRTHVTTTPSRTKKKRNTPNTTHTLRNVVRLALRPGLEPGTYRLEVCCSIH